MVLVLGDFFDGLYLERQQQAREEGLKGERSKRSPCIAPVMKLLSPQETISPFIVALL